MAQKLGYRRALAQEKLLEAVGTGVLFRNLLSVYGSLHGWFTLRLD